MNSDLPPRQPPGGGNSRLESWKEIADYLRREVRTVQRWEREQGLPVHRHSHHKRSSVYAFVPELDAWRAARSPESAPVVPLWKRPMFVFPVLAPALILALVGARVWSQSRPSAFLTIRTDFLIAGANAKAVAISPNGRYLAYIVGEDGGESLWVRDLTSAANLQVIAPSQPIDGPGYQTLAFSADSSSMRFVKMGVLYQVPILGGPPRAMASGLPAGHVYVSPDETRLAYRETTGSENAVIVADLDGSNQRKILRSPQPGSITSQLSWSPDGRRIAIGHNKRVSVVELDSGKETPISNREWPTVDRLEWLPNGHGLLVVTREPPLNLARPWYVSYPAGEAHPVTTDLLDYPEVSAAGDSRSFVAMQRTEVSSLWVVSPEPHRKAVKITEGQRRKDGVGGLVWGPNGRIVYVSSPSGAMQIWASTPAGTDPMPLTGGQSANFNPSACPDGRYIVFNSSAPRHVWRMQPNGSHLQQLTSGQDESWPICSPDSKWVLFLSTNPSYRLMRVSIDGGEPTVVTDVPLVMPSVSPNGKLLLGTLPDGKKNRVVVVPLNGEPMRTLFAVERPKVHWSPDGESILSVETLDGVRNVWSWSLDGAQRRQLTDFADNEEIRWFDVAQDGRLLIARGSTISDIVQIHDSN